MPQRITYGPNGEIVSVEEYTTPPELANADTLRARAEQAIDGLVAIKASSGALTVAQLSNAVRLLASVSLALLRLHLNRLESID